MTRNGEPILRIGLLKADGPQRFRLDGYFQYEGTQLPPGWYETSLEEGCISVRSEETGRPVLSVASSVHQRNRSNALVMRPASPACSFTVTDVPVGLGFHWQKAEALTYPGELEVLPVSDNEVLIINRVALEQYLVSVVSSEMNAYADRSFLEAQAVIARSWVLAQLNRSAYQTDASLPEGVDRWEWQDREAHSAFDLCSDDHCQRYHGLTRATTSEPADAVHATHGMVLWCDNQVVDARFSKCCGGVTERYETAWNDVAPPGLTSVLDADHAPAGSILPLRDDHAADVWIRGNPNVFCRVTDPTLLEKICLPMDRITSDFFRWEVTYSQEELSALVDAGMSVQIGAIRAIRPLQRGPSGRIYLLELQGERATVRIGKELLIRRILSTSHLKSSAFVVEHRDAPHGVPEKLTLRGAGWGHGVGLCQIGAGAMASFGSSTEAILAHYFPKAILRTYY